jgi:hypothetical protein
VSFILPEGGNKTHASSRAGGAIRKGGYSSRSLGVAAIATFKTSNSSNLINLSNFSVSFSGVVIREKANCIWRAKSAVRFKDGQLGQDGQDGKLGHMFFMAVRTNIEYLCSLIRRY